jgi:hypothetical protein
VSGWIVAVLYVVMAATLAAVVWFDLKAKKAGSYK